MNLKRSINILALFLFYICFSIYAEDNNNLKLPDIIIYNPDSSFLIPDIQRIQPQNSLQSLKIPSLNIKKSIFLPQNTKNVLFPNLSKNNIQENFTQLDIFAGYNQFFKIKLTNLFSKGSFINHINTKFENLRPNPNYSENYQDFEIYNQAKFQLSKHKTVELDFSYQQFTPVNNILNSVYKNLSLDHSFLKKSISSNINLLSFSSSLNTKQQQFQLIFFHHQFKHFSETDNQESGFKFKHQFTNRISNIKLSLSQSILYLRVSGIIPEKNPFGYKILLENSYKKYEMTVGISYYNTVSISHLFFPFNFKWKIIQNSIVNIDWIIGINDSVSNLSSFQTEILTKTSYDRIYQPQKQWFTQFNSILYLSKKHSAFGSFTLKRSENQPFYVNSNSVVESSLDLNQITLLHFDQADQFEFNLKYNYKILQNLKMISTFEYHHYFNLELDNDDRLFYLLKNDTPYGLNPFHLNLILNYELWTDFSISIAYDFSPEFKMNQYDNNPPYSNLSLYFRKKWLNQIEIYSHLNNILNRKQTLYYPYLTPEFHAGIGISFQM